MKNLFLGLAVCSLAMVSCGEKKADKKEEGKESATVENKKEKNITTTPKVVNTGEGVRVAWVNVDTLNAKYQRIIDANEEYLKMKSEAEKQVEILQKNYYKEIEKLNKEVLLQSEQEAAMRKVKGMEANIQEKASVIQNNLYEFEKRMAETNRARLTDYLNTYASNNNIDYIHSKSAVSGLLYANGIFDITDEVVNGLNAEYKASLEN